MLNSVISEVKGGYEFQGRVFVELTDLINTYQIRKKPLKISNEEVTLDVPIKRKSWELRHSSIFLGKELGSGSYGQVFKGVYRRTQQADTEVDKEEREGERGCRWL